jgi:hypothetical protein
MKFSPAAQGSTFQIANYYPVFFRGARLLTLTFAAKGSLDSGTGTFAPAFALEIPCLGNNRKVKKRQRKRAIVGDCNLNAICISLLGPASVQKYRVNKHEGDACSLLPPPHVADIAS